MKSLIVLERDVIVFHTTSDLVKGVELRTTQRNTQNHEQPKVTHLSQTLIPYEHSYRYTETQINREPQRHTYTDTHTETKIQTDIHVLTKRRATAHFHLNHLNTHKKKKRGKQKHHREKWIHQRVVNKIRRNKTERPHHNMKNNTEGHKKQGAN